MADTWNNSFWNSFFWSSAGSGSTSLIMVKLKTGLSRLKLTDKLTRLKAVRTALTGSVNFPVVNPTVATLNAKIAAIEAKIAEIDAKEAQIDTLRVERETLVKEGELIYAQIGADVANQSGDDVAKAVSSAYELADEPAAPVPLLKPQSVAASTGDAEGELDAQWDRLDGADAYLIEEAIDPNTGPWTYGAVVTISKVTLTNRPHMTQRWVRVAGVRGTEQGPFSDPAAGIVG